MQLSDLRNNGPNDETVICSWLCKCDRDGEAIDIATNYNWGGDPTREAPSAGRQKVGL
jgi:hypothetical protein